MKLGPYVTRSTKLHCMYCGKQGVTIEVRYWDNGNLRDTGGDYYTGYHFTCPICGKWFEQTVELGKVLCPDPPGECVV